MQGEMRNLGLREGKLVTQDHTADKSQICDIFNEIKECHEMFKANLLSSGKDNVTSGKEGVG